MIVASANLKHHGEFIQLLNSVIERLFICAKLNPAKYASFNGFEFEKEVFNLLKECAKNTIFDGLLKHTSNQAFPDIIAAKYFGIEIKCVHSNTYKSVGSSILESSRVPEVGQIHIIFAKLVNKNFDFLHRAYEDCLSDIAITHKPRYLINMKLAKNETIFSKMKISYDEFRNLENPELFYYEYLEKSKGAGEKVFGTLRSKKLSKPIIRFFNHLPKEQRNKFITYALVNFTEVFAKNYENFAVFLLEHFLIDTHLRDYFSAGGQFVTSDLSTKTIKLPAIFKRLLENKDLIKKLLSQNDPKEFFNNEQSDEYFAKNFQIWSEKIYQNCKNIKRVELNGVLNTIFNPHEP